MSLKFYKKYPQFHDTVANYIKQNHIRARYAGWVGMAADVDLVKVDGYVLKFNIKTGVIVKD